MRKDDLVGGLMKKRGLTDFALSGGVSEGEGGGRGVIILREECSNNPQNLGIPQTLFSTSRGYHDIVETLRSNDPTIQLRHTLKRYRKKVKSLIFFLI